MWEYRRRCDYTLYKVLLECSAGATVFGGRCDYTLYRVLLDDPLDGGLMGGVVTIPYIWE